MNLEFEFKPWMSVVMAFVAGMYVGLRPLVQVRKNSNGDGDISIIISIGLVSINPVNFNDNSRPIAGQPAEKDNA